MSRDKLDGFDSIAWIYDGLAGLVFGRSIRDAQSHFLQEIRDARRILILGGGTGWLLAHLLKINPHCEVWYIEASGKMLASTKRKITSMSDESVHLIHGTEKSIPDDIKYDAVIANFFLDMFSPFDLQIVIDKLIGSVTPGGKLLISDFRVNRIVWQRFLLWCMYRFFRAFCGIQARNLSDWHRLVILSGWREVASKHFYGDFIQSSLYELAKVPPK